MAEIFRAEELVGFQAAAGHEHIRGAGFHGGLEPHFCIQVVQFFQQASVLRLFKLNKIIGVVVLDNLFRNFLQEIRKVEVAFHCAKAVLKTFGQRTLMLPLHLPQCHILTGIAVGVGQVEDMAQLIDRADRCQERDTFRAAIHPAPQSVPGLYISAGGCIRFLCEDEKLVIKTVFVVVGGAFQKGHIGRRADRNIVCRLSRQCRYLVIFARHVIASVS